MSLFQTFAALAQIILIDITMSGDNAIAIGMAASGLPEEGRRRAVLAGILSATILRVIFAIFAVKILQITGLLVAGGLLLLWVSWQMYRDLFRRATCEKKGASKFISARNGNAEKNLDARHRAKSSSPMFRCLWTMCWRWPVSHVSIRAFWPPDLRCRFY